MANDDTHALMDNTSSDDVSCALNSEQNLKETILVRVCARTVHCADRTRTRLCAHIRIVRVRQSAGYLCRATQQRHAPQRVQLFHSEFGRRRSVAGERAPRPDTPHACVDVVVVVVDTVVHLVCGMVMGCTVVSSAADRAGHEHIRQHTNAHDDRRG